MPKKKYFNSLINNTTPFILDNQFCYNIQNEIRHISNFNPYDTDIKYNNNFSHKYNDGDIDNYNHNDNYIDNFNNNDNDNDNYDRRYIGNKTMINLKKNNDEIEVENNNFTFYNQIYDENENNEEEDENGKNELFISKINQYLNNSSDYENLFNDKAIKQNFSSPKFKLKYSKELNKSRHSIKNQNKNKVYFTDLEKGLINNKIKSTNYSSKNSFYNENHKNEIKGKSKKEIKHINKVHISNINKKIRKIHVNSLISSKKTHLDMVRPGIGLYGLSPFEHTQHKLKLKPVLTWKTKIIYLKKVPSGFCVSYGRTFVTNKNSVIATVPVGYADGYSRVLSNKADVLVRGKKCPVAGRITMDMMMIDVTDVKGVSIGDEVVLLGTQGKETIKAEELAKLENTISYEVTCSISPRVPRIIV